MKTELTFGSWLKRRRRGLGLTQAELGRRVGYAGETIRKVEADQMRPSRQLAEQLAHHLEIAPPERATFLRFARDESGGDSLEVPTSSVAVDKGARLQPHHTLPAHPLPLIGREQELDAVRRFLLGQDIRLLTLTGPGGTGKTRLAVQAAVGVLDNFADGIVVVVLTPIQDPTLVAATIAQTLEVEEEPGKPILTSLKEYLRDKQLLLVLDNFEQVVAAAPVVAELLAVAPRLKVLVTSREVLHLQGEQSFTVPPLAVPDPQRLPSLDPLMQYAAVRLFVERAQAARADFQVTQENAAAVATICHRLDGLPLAIELAAARVTVFSPQGLLARLGHGLKLLTGGARDLPPRQQTLRATLAWSYDLLSASEQALFRRLAVFVGGCTLEAAEAVCDADGDLTMEVVDGVASLVDKSLLWQVPATIPAAEPGDDDLRFTMLETLREYALEQLREAGEEAGVRDRHLDFFLALAEEAAPRLQGAAQLAWADRLQREHDNLRAALRWSLREHGGADAGLRLAAALVWFWIMRGYVSEGRRWLEQVLDRPAASTPGPRARALLAAGIAITHSGVTDARLQVFLEESLALGDALGDRRHSALCRVYLGAALASHGSRGAGRALVEVGLATGRELGDRWLVATALHWLRSIMEELGNYGEADAAARECVTLNQALGNTWGLAAALTELGRMAAEGGDHVAARAHFQESLTLFRQLRSRSGIMEALDGLATATMRAGDYQAARALFEEVLGMARDLDHPLVMHAIAQLGWAALCEGDTSGAAARFEESIQLYREAGEGKGVAWMTRSLGYVAQQQGHLERAAALFAESLVESRDAGSARRGSPVVLAAIAQVAAVRGEAERAARLFGVAEMVDHNLRVHLYAHTAGLYEQGVAAARAQLGDEQFAALYAEGQAMTLEEAVAYALEEGPDA